MALPLKNKALPLKSMSLPLKNKALPLRAIHLINAFSKPLTRPDWKTSPTFSLNQFFKGVKKTNTYVLLIVYWKIIKGICHYHLKQQYNELIKLGFSKNDALLLLKQEHGLEPNIIMLMCNI